MEKHKFCMQEDYCSKKPSNSLKFFSFFFFFFFIVFASTSIITAQSNPVGPDSVGVVANETKSAPATIMLNISGGRIATINITSDTQNTKWKGIVGSVYGSFTLDDASGATLYDWSLSTILGEVYATRNSSSLNWTAIKCANNTLMEVENGLLSHTNAQDNITKTFNQTNHTSFTIAAITIANSTCPSLRTYVNNASQANYFQEIVVTDSQNMTGGNLIFATRIEENLTGFDGAQYDFQMIVPEIGTVGYTGQTAYYLYIEIS